ncbi:MAG: hypothetical protein MRY83_16930 [Flavobacteriales bacterium]|nr:hypothetical protein [Flavobacteriales bacterium]
MFCLPYHLKSQDYVFLNKSRESSLFVCLTSDESYAFFLKKVESYYSRNSRSFLVINAERVNIELIKNKINEILNRDPYIVNIANVYLGIVGNTKFFRLQEQISMDIFASKFVLNMEEEEFLSRDFEIFSKEESIDAIVSNMEQDYLWQATIHKIQNSNYIDSVTTKNDFSLGFGISRNIPKAIRWDSFNPSSYITYGLSAGMSLGEYWSLNSNLFMNFKFPSQKKIQSRVQSQINPQDVLNGDDITVNLNMELEARIHVNFNFEARRYWLDRAHKIRPFAGFGLGLGRFMNGQGSIDTTITIEASSVSPGGGSPELGLGDGNPGESGLEQLSYGGPSLMPSLGLECTLNRVTRLNFKTSYQLPLVSLNGQDPSVNHLDFQFGLMFSLNKRTYRSIEYLRLKSMDFN